MSDESPPTRHRRGLQVLAAFYAVVGGSLAAGLLFGGLSVGALAIGVAVTIELSAASGRRSAVQGGIGLMLGYSLAFALLTWPLLFLAAGAIWGKWE